MYATVFYDRRFQELTQPKYSGVMLPLPELENMRMNPFVKMTNYNMTVNSVMLYSIYMMDYMVGVANGELGLNLKIQIDGITRDITTQQRQHDEYQTKLDSGQLPPGPNRFANPCKKGPGAHNTGSAMDIIFTGELQVKDLRKINPYQMDEPITWLTNEQKQDFRDANFINLVQREAFINCAYDYYADELTRENNFSGKIMTPDEFAVGVREKTINFACEVWQDMFVGIHIAPTEQGMKNPDLIKALMNDRVRTQLIVSTPYLTTINKETWHAQLCKFDYDFPAFTEEDFAKQDPERTEILAHEIYEMAEDDRNMPVFQQASVTPGLYYDRQSVKSINTSVKLGFTDWVVERIRQIYLDRDNMTNRGR